MVKKDTRFTVRKSYPPVTNRSGTVREVYDVCKGPEVVYSGDKLDKETATAVAQMFNAVAKLEGKIGRRCMVHDWDEVLAVVNQMVYGEDC